MPPKVENFYWRIEHMHVREGGVAMNHGDPCTGKSWVLRLLAQRLSDVPDITVGAIHHWQSKLAGDARLFDKLRHDDLVPLGLRICTRLITEFASHQDLLACLEHRLHVRLVAYARSVIGYIGVGQALLAKTAFGAVSWYEDGVVTHGPQAFPDAPDKSCMVALGKVSAANRPGKEHIPDKRPLG